jgi:hypothetical protein
MVPPARLRSRGAGPSIGAGMWSRDREAAAGPEHGAGHSFLWPPLTGPTLAATATTWPRHGGVDHQGEGALAPYPSGDQAQVDLHLLLPLLDSLPLVPCHHPGPDYRSPPAPLPPPLQHRSDGPPPSGLVPVPPPWRPRPLSPSPSFGPGRQNRRWDSYPPLVYMIGTEIFGFFKKRGF